MNCSVVHERGAACFRFSRVSGTFHYYFFFVSAYFVWYKFKSKDNQLNKAVQTVIIFGDNRDRQYSHIYIGIVYHNLRSYTLHNVDLRIFRYYLLHFIDTVFKTVINLSTESLLSFHESFIHFWPSFLSLVVGKYYLWSSSEGKECCCSTW